MKNILWADDEIELLQPYVIYLEKTLGHSVTTVANGSDAIEEFVSKDFDLIVLDEQMPGMNGLDVLKRMKDIRPETPVVMMTKSEAVETMQTAIGRLVDDYLVKPVNLAQMTVCLKKIFEKQALVADSTQQQFLQEYGQMSQQIGQCTTWDDWATLYRKIVTWELRLEDNRAIGDTLVALKEEANTSFAKFVEKNYMSWVTDKEHRGDGPLMSHQLLSHVIKPLIKAKEKVALIVIDNFRLDQWEVIRPQLAGDFSIRTELYSSIVPTATQFARNSIFSGLLPGEIKKLLPELWIDQSDNEDSLNANERELLSNYFERQRMSGVRSAYYKVNFSDSGENIIKKFGGYEKNDLNALVYNFVDMLSHACTDNRTLKELIPTDSAYRNITRQWFLNGTLHEMLNLLRKKGFKIILTTDHGTIRVGRPIEVKGLKSLNTNIRYKTGKMMSYNPKEVYEMKNPSEAGLPLAGAGVPYIFATSDKFFVYPNNRNEYIHVYDDSFQHGGVSMEEMILPLVTLVGKK